MTSTLISRGRRGTNSHPRSFCVAGVALMAMGGALGPAWSRVTPRHFCVAGVARGDIHFDFTWQAWHNLTSTVVLRGRRGTHGTGWRAWARLVARTRIFRGGFKLEFRHILCKSTSVNLYTIYIYISLSIYLSIGLSIYLSIYLCVCVYMCVWIILERDESAKLSETHPHNRS